MKEVFDLIANRINDAYKKGYQAGLRMAEKPYLSFAVGDEIMLRSECDNPDCEKIILTRICPCDKTEGAGIFSDGSVIDELDLRKMIPTGRKFPEVIALLKKMQEGTE